MFNLDRDPRGFRLSITISFLVRETKDGLVNIGVILVD